MKKDLVIAIAGADGFVGRALAARLRAAGHTVIPIPDEPGLLPGSDVLIHLEREADPSETRRLVSRLGDAVSRPRVFLHASSVDVYGHRPGEPLDESSVPGHSTRARSCLAAEREALAAERRGIRTVLLRFGAVLDPSGGCLGRLLPLMRRGLCFVLGDPGDRFSWISLEDGLRLLEFAMERESLRGVLNVTAPVAATQGAFARATARLAGRRVLGRLRSRFLRRTLGVFSDILDVAPARALQEGFGHVHPTLQFWSDAMLEASDPLRKNA
jgi:NAD dependent epimerase/dehydratase family enzyme